MSTIATLAPAEVLVSVVMPCLNEEQTVAICVAKVRKAFEDTAISGEVIVADNGSIDRSVELAEAAGARVVHQPTKGYGSAYLRGLDEARGEYLIMGDCDDTYDFEQIPLFLEKLAEGRYEFVTGSRYLMSEGKKEISFLHRHVGNPFLTIVLNALFSTRYTDVYCGYRAFTRRAYEKIRPTSTGMEFNLELAINAALSGLRVAEVPIILGPRKGTSKLRTFRDGWRSLRMMLLYSPRAMFLAPATTLILIGLCAHVASLLGLSAFGGRQFNVATGVMGMLFSILGFRILLLGLYVDAYGWRARFEKKRRLAQWFDEFKLELGLLAGGILSLAGLVLAVRLVAQWLIQPGLSWSEQRWAAVAVSALLIGIDTLFSCVFVSSMSLTSKAKAREDRRE